MTNTFIFLLLSAVLLAQCSLMAAESKENSSSSEESGSNEKPVASNYISELKKLPPRLQILIIALQESESLSKIATQKAATLFGKVLRDSAVVSAPSAILKVHLDRFSQYSEEVQRLRTLSQISYNLEVDATPLQQLLGDIVLGSLKLGAEFGNMVQLYNTSVVLVAPTMEDLLVRLLLERNDFPQLLQTLSTDFAILKLVFFEEMDRYVTVLPPEARINEAKTIDWYKRFKAEPKIQNFYEFFSFYSKEEMQTAAKFLLK